MSDQSSQPTTEAVDITEAITEASNAFDELCQQRHNLGAEQYGSFTFLGNDTVRMMLEELADVQNYIRYHSIKLILLQSLMEEQVPADTAVNVGMGIGAFKGTSFGWEKK
jgi:hypothetical protein